MRVRPVLLGVVAGLLIGAAVGMVRLQRVRAAQAVPLAEDHGRIVRVVMQYQPEAGAMAAPIYRQFLTAVGHEIEVVWVVARAADLDDLKSRLGPAWPEGRYRSVVTGKPITTWAKDRFVAMRAPNRAGRMLACAPARTRDANPLRINDQEVPYVLAREAGDLFGAVGTEADFDAGDFLATRRHLFATPAIVEKNPPREAGRFHTTDDLTRHLNGQLSGTVTWLADRPEDTPPHHVGMFLTVMGGTAAVGDVRLAEAVAAAHPEVRAALRPARGGAEPRFRDDLIRQLDHTAARMAALGYTVVRVPLQPSASPKAWMSYNNGIVETRSGQTIFYMPTFGAPALDQAAAETFRRSFGCTVIPIDCAGIWHLGGSLHCLVNVVDRTE